MPIELAKLKLTNLSEIKREIRGAIWNANQELHIYISGGNEYAGVHDYDRGVSEPINSSGE